MNRSDILAHVAAETEEPLGIVEQIVDTLLTTIIEETCAGRQIYIEDFGRWRTNMVGAHEGQPAYRRLDFRAVHEWRRRLHDDFEHREAAD